MYGEEAGRVLSRGLRRRERRQPEEKKRLPQRVFCSEDQRRAGMVLRAGGVAVHTAV